MGAAIPRTLVVACVVCVSAGTASAQISLDGSVGGYGAAELTGPDYEISADMGATVGTNLFHSFGAFNVHAHESARFTGPDGLANVISRVTGGTASTIDGYLASEIPGADVWFINPAGILFGPNAYVDVPGAFHASTAAFVRLADGSMFSAVDPAGSVLTAAAPEAFGFLAAHPPGPLTVETGYLGVPAGETLSLVGGEVRIGSDEVSPYLEAYGGRINVASVAGAGHVAISDAGLDTSDVTGFGDIHLTQAYVAADGEPSGRISIRGGQLILNEFSILVADNYSGEDGLTPGIDIGLSGGLFLAPGEIHADAHGDGDAGAVRITAAGLSLADYSLITSGAYAGGDAGAVEIVADEVSLTGGGAISAGTGGTAPAATISITADRITLSEEAEINADSTAAAADLAVAGEAAPTPGAAGTIALTATEEIVLEGYAVLVSAQTKDGAGGRIVLTGGDVRMDHGAKVAASTGGDGPAGTIEVSADTFEVIGESGVLAFTKGEPEDTGNAGIISIDAATVSIGGSSGVSVLNQSAGEGGAITVDASHIDIHGGARIDAGFEQDRVAAVPGPSRAGRIGMTAGESLTIRDDGTLVAAEGTGGHVSLSGPGVRIVDGSLVAISTFDDGDAGGMEIRAGVFELSGESGLNAFTRGDFASTGNAGNITIEAGEVLLTGDSQISALTQTEGRGGNVAMTADEIHIGDGAGIEAGFNTELQNEVQEPGAPGSITLVARRELVVSGYDTALTAKTADAEGGMIALGASAITIDHGAVISTLTTRDGHGGSIDIRGDRISIAGDSLILATSAGAEDALGAGGSIRIAGGHISLTDSVLLTETVTGGRGGDIEIVGTRIDLSNQFVGAESFGSGAAGSISVSARGGLGIDASSLTSQTFSSAGGGDITVGGLDVSLTSAALVDASTNGSGPGGVVRVTADRSLSIEGADSRITSGSFSTDPGAGAGGFVGVEGVVVRIAGGGAVQTVSEGPGPAGDILVVGRERVILERGSVTTEALTADGGRIEIRAAELVFLDQGTITTTVLGGSGNAGDIMIDPVVILLQDSRIVANALAGAGGNITIVADFLFVDPDSIIDASSQLGVSGTVTFVSPETDLQSVLALPAPQFLDVATMLAASCPGRSGQPRSSLVRTGREALPADPSRHLTPSIIADRMPVAETDAMVPPAVIAATPDATFWEPASAATIRSACLDVSI